MPTDPRITKARRVGAAAVAEAAKLQAQGNKGVNRSTATRAAYKAKADGLDAVLAVLSPPQVAKSAKAPRARSAAKSGVRPRPKATTRTRTGKTTRKR